MVYSSKTLTESYNDVKSISEIIYETETNWNTLMKAMGILELASVEKHGEVIYEAVDIRAFFRKIKEFFKGLLEKIRKLFKNIISNLKNLFSKSEKTFKNVDISKLKKPNTSETIIANASINLKHLDRIASKLDCNPLNYLVNQEYSDKIKRVIDNEFPDEYDFQNLDDSMMFSDNSVKFIKDAARGKIIYHQYGPISSEKFIDELYRFFNINDKKDLTWNDVDIKESIKIITDRDQIDKIEQMFSKQEYELERYITRISRVANNIEHNAHPGFVSLLSFYADFCKDFYINILNYDQICLLAVKINFNQHAIICKHLAAYNHIKYDPAHYNTNVNYFSYDKNT